MTKFFGHLKGDHLSSFLSQRKLIIQNLVSFSLASGCIIDEVTQLYLHNHVTHQPCCNFGTGLQIKCHKFERIKWLRDCYLQPSKGIGANISRWIINYVPCCRYSKATKPHLPYTRARRTRPFVSLLFLSRIYCISPSKLVFDNQWDNVDDP